MQGSLPWERHNVEIRCVPGQILLVACDVRPTSANCELLIVRAQGDAIKLRFTEPLAMRSSWLSRFPLRYRATPLLDAKRVWHRVFNGTDEAMCAMTRARGSDGSHDSDDGMVSVWGHAVTPPDQCCTTA